MIDPNYDIALETLGECYLVDDPLKAKGYFDRVLQQNDNNVTALIRVGILLQQGKHGIKQNIWKAQEYLERALDQRIPDDQMRTCAEIALESANTAIKEYKRRPSVLAVYIIY